MKVLIGYSRCPYTREAFEAAGCEVWTCDLLEYDHPRHFQCDIWEVTDYQWDFALFHPMCTYLTVSAAWAFKDPDFERYPEIGYHQRVKEGTLTGVKRREARERALNDFRRLLALPYPHAIENPAPSFISSAIRPPDQIVQPYEFGDDASKGTGLWLSKDVPKLQPTQRFLGRFVEYKGNTVERWSNQTDSGQNRLPPSDKRWLERSATYPGIAAAAGDQWGNHFMRVNNER